MEIEKTVQKFITELNNLTPKSNCTKYEKLLNSIHNHIRANSKYNTDTFKDKECIDTYEDIKANIKASDNLEQRRLTKYYNIL